MKKMICLFMAAVFVVVMMVPMEARASSGYVEGTNAGPPTINNSGGFYTVGDEWDEVVSHPTDPSMSSATYYSAYKDYVQYLTIDISSLWANCGYLGYYEFIAPFDLKFSTTFNSLESQSFSVSIVDVEFVGQSAGVQFVKSVYQYHQQFAYAGSYPVTYNLGHIRVASSERLDTGIDGFNQISLKIVYRVSCDSGSISGLKSPPDMAFDVEMASWGKTMFYSAPLEKSWFDDLKSSIVGSLSEFKTAVDNKFTTLFTFGRQWTDDIIDAIVGQSGGGGISSAQDELDNQLNSIEVVEQQLSDQVADKIEVPSVSLNADETGGLRWVITTINSLYLSFNELHVMFACVVFFGIIAVLLFGRRNL